MSNLWDNHWIVEAGRPQNRDHSPFLPVAPVRKNQTDRLQICHSQFPPDQNGDRFGIGSAGKEIL